MGGKNAKNAQALNTGLPTGEEPVNSPQKPCKKNKDPQLLVKVYYNSPKGKKYVSAKVTANTLSENSATKKGLADFSYVLPGEYTVKVESVLAPDDSTYVATATTKKITLVKGDKKTVDIEVELINILTPKIEAEYKVVVLDRNIVLQADTTAEKLWTVIQVSYTQSNPAHPYPFDDVEFTCGPEVTIYTDEKCATELVGDLKLPVDTKKKLYLKGKTAGQFTASLKFKDPANPLIKPADDPADQVMAVVPLELNLYKAEKPHDKVFLSADPATHTLLSHDDKIDKGRMLMVQKGNLQGRAKLVVKKPSDDLWAIGEDNYKVIVGSKNSSGSIKLFTAENAGQEKAFKGNVLELVKADFSAGDIPFWVEGTAATNDFREASLYLGINRKASGIYETPKGYGDLARFTVVEFNQIGPTADDKQHINLPEDGVKPRQGRKIKPQATLTKPLLGIPVLFTLIPHGNNKTGLQAILEHQKPKSGDAAFDTSALGVAESTGLDLSAYGGDKFKVAAYLKDAPPLNDTCPDGLKSHELTVWRRLNYDAVYTMSGETYIDTATVPAEIEPAYTPAFIEYLRAAVQTIDAGLTVKYIGLYDDAAVGKQKNWPADFSPAAMGFAPTPQELTDLAGVDVGAKAIAKAAIEVKAQNWFNAICGSYSNCCSAWFAAVGVLPGNSLLAVQYYHPKLSGIDADGVTTFWPAGISINGANPGSGLNQPIHPDSMWRNVQGFNRGSTSVVFKNYGTAARLQIVCRHEIGHATKAAFGRDDFGVGDHSASDLMTPYGGSNMFSAADQNLLRGWKA